MQCIKAAGEILSGGFCQHPAVAFCPENDYITCIFPNFDADENDPASYDFGCTDETILVCLEAGTKTFFRLGQTIEHQIVKHGTLPRNAFLLIREQ